MSAVVGCDISTKALDLVKLDEDTSRAVWVRCELAGKDAWERLLSLPEQFSDLADIGSAFFDDVYLVAIEEPRGRGQLRTNALLNRVVGAVAARLPYRLRAPERCWVVPPNEWRDGLGLPHNAKPSEDDIARVIGARCSVIHHAAGLSTDNQNFRDAYALALWAREQVNKAAETKSLPKEAV